MRKQFEVGIDNVTVSATEEFDWINSGKSAYHIDLTITDNDPPLDSNHYDVAPTVPEPARARSSATSGSVHYYQCMPPRFIKVKGELIRTNPKIIIS